MHGQCQHVWGGDRGPCQVFGLVDGPPPPPCSVPRGHFGEARGCCWLRQTHLPPSSPRDGRSLRSILTGKIKAGLQSVLRAIWLFWEGILAETVLPPQAPVDIIYTLIELSQLLPGSLPRYSQERSRLSFWGPKSRSGLKWDPHWGATLVSGVARGRGKTHRRRIHPSGKHLGSGQVGL